MACLGKAGILGTVQIGLSSRIVRSKPTVALRRRKGISDKAEGVCPIGACMDFLGGAWAANVIWHLQNGARRFSELESDMAPITAKVLSNRLKDLSRKGVIARVVKDTSPPSVEYELTALGRELVPAIAAIASVGLKLKQANNLPMLDRRRTRRA